MRLIVQGLTQPGLSLTMQIGVSACSALEDHEPRRQSHHGRCQGHHPQNIGQGRAQDRNIQGQTSQRRDADRRQRHRRPERQPRAVANHRRRRQGQQAQDRERTGHAAGENRRKGAGHAKTDDDQDRACGRRPGL